jgi:uncharacterized membrane protein
MLTVISMLLGEYHSFYLSEISPQSLTALVYLTAVVTIVGFTDFYWLVRVTTPSLANTFAYVSPVIAVILGWALLHEEITIVTIIPMSVILAGVAIMVTTPGKKKEKGHSDMQRVKDREIRKHIPYQVYGQYHILNTGHCNALYVARFIYLYLLDDSRLFLFFYQGCLR